VELSGWDVGAVAIKTVVYAATLGAAGTVFFLAYSADLLTEPQRAKIARLLGIQIIVAALASLLRILLLTGAMSGEISGMFDRDMAGMILGAGEGACASVRIAGLALAACVFARKRRLQWPALIGAALAAASFAAMGHTRTLQPHLPATLLSCLHLIGVAFWIGALVPLLACTQGVARDVGLMAKRFGGLAVVVVSLLIAAGLALLWMISHGHADFWSSAYGTMIAAKLLFVAVLLSAAAVNKLRLTPKLMSAAPGAVLSLRRSIQLEILAGLLVLLVTASATSLVGPPR
jgi:putative copper resistance protein D